MKRTAVAIFLVSFVALITAGCATRNGAQFHPKDARKALSDEEMFYLLDLFDYRVYYEDEEVVKTDLVPAYLQSVKYSRELALAFQERRTGNPSFAQRFEKARDKALRRLEPTMSEHVGKERVFGIFRDRGIYHEVLDAAGPPPPLPNPRTHDPWGSRNKPFAHRMDARNGEVIVTEDSCDTVKSTARIRKAGKE